MGSRIELRNYQVEQIVQAVNALFEKYGLGDNALPAFKWAKLGASLKSGEHDEFYLRNGGNEHIRRIDVVGHPAGDMNLVVVYGPSDTPDYPLTRELRVLVHAWTKGAFCKPEQPILRAQPSEPVPNYRLLAAQPECVRTQRTAPDGQWLQLDGRRRYALYVAPPSPEGDQPFIRIIIFANPDQRDGLPVVTESTVTPASYADFDRIDRFMAAQQPA